MVALTDIQYRNIIQTLLRGFGDSRPNPRVAAILTAEANLGMRVGDILRLRMCDIVLVQRLLQHSSPMVTRRYIGVSDEQMEAAIARHVNIISA